MSSDPTARRAGYALARSEGPFLKHVAGNFVLKVSERTVGAGASVAEYVARRGEEPPPHVHEREDEMFYVLEGRAAVHCGGSTYEVDEGGFVFLPQGLKHTFDVLSDDGLRLLVITAPTRAGAGSWGGFLGDLERVNSGG